MSRYSDPVPIADLADKSYSDKESDPNAIEGWGTMRDMNLPVVRGEVYAGFKEEYENHHNPNSTWKMRYCSFCKQWGEDNSNLFFGKTEKQGEIDVHRVICKECFYARKNGNYAPPMPTPVMLEVPDEYKDARITDFLGFFDDEAQGSICGFPKDPHMLMFKGESGAGKTRAAWAMSKESAGKRGVKPLFYHCQALKQLWERERKTDGGDFIFKMYDAKFIVIDDLNGAIISPGFWKALEGLVDHRKQHSRLATIITTNAGESELSANFGESMMRRLGMFYHVTFMLRSLLSP